MIRTERLYRIRLKISDIKKVVSVYNILTEKSFIEFIPVGSLSNDVDVKFENPLLTSELQKAGVLFRTRPMIEKRYIDLNGSSYAEMRDSWKSAIPVLDEFWKFRTLSERASRNQPANDNTNQAKSDLSKIKLQRTKITEKSVLNFKLEKPRSKWEIIKALQEEFDKIPDDVEFRSFTAFGIGAKGSRYL